MPETTELMKRPHLGDDLTKRRAWEILEPKVKAYIGSDWSESEAPFIKKQVLDAMSPHKDGYGMARQLERDGWEEDRGLMELMDEAQDVLRAAHAELVKQWIQTYSITPIRKMGDSVSTTHWGRKGQTGIIAKVYEDEAKYGVRFPDHSLTSWQILLYEEVIDAQAEEVA
jgi:hypothetical protein